MPTKSKNVKKLNIPKVELLQDDVEEPKPVVKSEVQIKAEKEEAEYVAPEPVNEIADAIVPDVI